MVHNPCGTQNPQSPCMDGNKCSKSFPKPFRDQTTVSDDSYSNLRRRNDGKQHMINEKEVDNRWVVPHSPWLIWKSVLYPARVITCGIHGRGDGLQKFHGMGGWIPWNGGWIPYFFQMDSIPFPDGFHIFFRWIPYYFHMESRWNKFLESLFLT